MFDTVTEKVIEDILSTDKSILAGVLSVNQSNLRSIARQKKNELVALQSQSKLIKTKINKVVLVTEAKKEHFVDCEREQIKLIAA